MGATESKCCDNSELYFAVLNKLTACVEDVELWSATWGTRTPGGKLEGYANIIYEVYIILKNMLFRDKH
jgi:hypothetical protein